MIRNSLSKYFKSAGPAVLPVIHTLDEYQAARNIQIAMREGAHGVFLINHDFPHDKLIPIIRAVRSRFPGTWIGANFLAVTGRDAFPILGELQASGCPVDAYWADDARIDERISLQAEADAIDAVRRESGWHGLYFGGTAFKKQRDVAPALYGEAATRACAHMDVVTTSGIATGKAADLGKIETFRQACADHALALASGVTVENVAEFVPLVDAILVATGINHEGDFYHIDQDRLRAMLRIVRETAVGKIEGERDP